MKNIRKEKRERYYKNPKLCLECEELIPFELRNKNQYCSHSCSAARYRLAPISCKFCKEEFHPSEKRIKCCSRECDNLWKWENIMKPKILEGKCQWRKTLRKFLIERDGDECSVCHIEDWDNKPITFHVDHIDGNPADNSPQNLRLICPNCDSQGKYYAGRNKGYGRKSRGLSRWY